MLRLVVVFCVFIVVNPSIAIAQEPAPGAPSSPAPPPPQAPQGQGSTSGVPEGDRPWWQTLTFGGDFRLRFETFRMRDTPDRNRGRYRLRLEGNTDVDRDLSLHFRLATGNPADPTTSNQSFDGFLTKKSFAVDYAFASYHPEALAGLTLAAGKFQPPIPYTDMTWEGNINWEGSYEQFATPASRALGVRLVASQVVLEESGDGSDSLLFAESAEVSLRPGGHHVRLALTDQFFRNADPIAAAVNEGVLDTRNTNLTVFDAAEQPTGFESGFHLVDGLAEVVVETGRSRYPLKLTANLVRNLRAASEEDTGLWLAATYGLAESPKTVSLNYTFARIEQESVLSPYTFDPLPGSNVRLNMVEFSIMPKARQNIDFNAIFWQYLAGSSQPWMTDLQASFRFSF